MLWVVGIMGGWTWRTGSGGIMNAILSLSIVYQTIIKIMQQISPWTIYDNLPKGPQQPSQSSVSSPLKPKISPRLLPLLKQPPKQKLINQLLQNIAVQKRKLQQKLNILSVLKLVKGELFEETNPINKIRFGLAKLGEDVGGGLAQKDEISEGKRLRNKAHFISQRLNIIHQTANDDILDDFSKIFISNSHNSPSHMYPHTNQKSPPKAIHNNSNNNNNNRQFPKIKKNKSVLLPDLQTKRQFDDNSIHEVIELAKNKYYRKKSYYVSDPYSYPV